jgi:hypothetical protein
VLGFAGGSELVVVPWVRLVFEGPSQLEAVVAATAEAVCEWLGRHLKQQSLQRAEMQTG